MAAFSSSDLHVCLVSSILVIAEISQNIERCTRNFWTLSQQASTQGIPIPHSVLTFRCSLMLPVQSLHVSHDGQCFALPSSAHISMVSAGYSTCLLQDAGGRSLNGSLF